MAGFTLQILWAALLACMEQLLFQPEQCSIVAKQPCFQTVKLIMPISWTTVGSLRTLTCPSLHKGTILPLDNSCPGTAPVPPCSCHEWTNSYPPWPGEDLEEMGGPGAPRRRKSYVWIQWDRFWTRIVGPGTPCTCLNTPANQMWDHLYPLFCSLEGASFHLVAAWRIME